MTAFFGEKNTLYHDKYVYINARLGFIIPVVFMFTLAILLYNNNKHLKASLNVVCVL